MSKASKIKNEFEAKMKITNFPLKKKFWIKLIFIVVVIEKRKKKKNYLMK